MDKNKGIYYRGKLLKDVCAKLPRVQEGTQEGTPEGCFFLLTSGSMPTKKEAQEVTNEWLKRGSVPRYCLRMIDSMDKRVHPMAQLCAASACLNPQSQFVEAYTKGARRADYWKYSYEDSMNLIAMLPTVAAAIYSNVFRDGEGSREVNYEEDWSGNFCRMLGLPEKDFVDLMRLYMILHADHERQCFRPCLPPSRNGAQRSLPVFLGQHVRPGWATSWFGQSGSAGLADKA